MLVKTLILQPTFNPTLRVPTLNTKKIQIQPTSLTKKTYIMSSTSVVRSSGLLRSPKSIMRRASRPMPLPLSPSPFPFSTSFNILLSAARSSHVHFPPSPAMFATFATHSPSSYDRGPYPVSPSSQLNALSLTSPLLSGFKLSDPPKRNRTKTASTVLQPQDPRSPRPAVMQSFAAAMSIGSKPRTKLNKALTTYPRSPYPSAPLSPDVKISSQQAKAQEPADGKPRGRASSAPSIARSKRSTTSEGVRTLTRPTQDVKEKEPQNITFQMTSSRRLAPPHLDLSAASFLPPVQKTTVHAATNPKAVNQSEDDLSALSDASNGEMSRLSNAFWQSVSIEVEEEGSDQNNGFIEFGGFPGSGGASSDGGFPESVTGSQVSDSEDALLRGLMSPRPGRGMMIMPRIRVPPTQERLPTLTFGTSDGSVWSPGANESSFSSISDEHDRLLAVGDTLTVPRSIFTAPTPNDPFAQFPSFAAALEAGDADSTTTSKGMGLGSYLGTSIVDSVKLPARVHMP